MVLRGSSRFFARARTVVDHTPEQVTTDGHDAHPRAIPETLGPEVQHRTSRSMNTRMEQEDHRGIKQSSATTPYAASARSIRLMQRPASAPPTTNCAITCALVTNRHDTHEPVSLADQQQLFHARWGDVCALLQAAPAAWARSTPVHDGLMGTPAPVRSES